ncbi:hypothetical protein [Shewanella frigidimarina]|uniref:hypothetical protein n=1 Tax=Shewanella frigidimarina TaxID=56812 RepID=UPI003D7A98E3
MLRPNRSRHGKEAFYQALRASVIDLATNNIVEKINQSSVIKNAKFTDGTSVGETTLYGKKSDKQYIHKDFMLELDALIESASTKNSKRKTIAKKIESKSESIVRLRAEIKELTNEYQVLLGQFVELEVSYKKVNDNSNTHIIQSLESEIFVLASLLNSRIDGRVRQIANVVERYETKHSGQVRLTHAKAEVTNLERKISDSTVTSLFGNIGDK